MRSDAPLIKHISKTYSPKTGWAWQVPPSIEIPRTSTDDLDRIYNAARPAMTAGTGLPFHDSVLDLWMYEDDDPDASDPVMHLWARISTGDEYVRRMKLTSPWCFLVNPNPPTWAHPEVRSLVADFPRLGPDIRRAYAVVEVWTENEGTFIPEPMCHALFGDPSEALIPFPLSWMTTQIGVLSKLARADRRNALEKVVADNWNDARNAVTLSLYLTVCPEYLVEERPEIPDGTPVRRNPDPKPWTYNYLPRVILLDPRQAPSGESKPHLGGTHASPRPHQRRGHWATLRHPKFQRNADGSPRQIFVKPAWVGPREWIMQGSRYRVLDVANQAVQA